MDAYFLLRFLWPKFHLLNSIKWKSQRKINNFSIYYHAKFGDIVLFILYKIVFKSFRMIKKETNLNFRSLSLTNDDTYRML